MIIKPLTDHRWKGYTLEELQEQIAVNEARIMLQTRRIESNAKDMKPSANIAQNGYAGLFTTILTYAEYLVLGINMIRKIKPYLAALRKKQD